MTTAAARLVQLAGQSGAAGTVLALIGAGTTAASRLVAYSGLASAAAAAHLMTDVAAPEVPSGGGHAVGGWNAAPRRYRPKEEDEAILLSILH